MTKLLITRGAEFTGQEWIRFDIRSDGINKTAEQVCSINRWAALLVDSSDEMIPCESFEVRKEMTITNIGNVIDLLNSYLGIIQRERE